MRRLLAVTAVGLVAAFAGSAVAAPPPVPVGVYQDKDGRVCVWVSLQVPQCTPPVLAVVPGH